MRITVSTAFLIVTALVGASAATATEPGDNSAAPAVVEHADGSLPLELGVTYSAQHSNLTTGPNFWLQGASIDLSAPLGRGFGLALDVSREHVSDIRGSGDDLTLLTAAVGPRYTWSTVLPGTAGRRWDFFGEALLGVADGHDSFYPAGSQPHTVAFAWQVGGGIDIELSPHWALRPLQVDWVRTSFRNGTTDVQNSLRLGAGIVFRFPAQRAPVAVLPVRAPAPLAAAVPPPAPPSAGLDQGGAVADSGARPAPAADDRVRSRPAADREEIKLPVVEFATDSARLRPQAVAALDGAVAILKQHPDLSIEVQGHTDSRGTDRYNLILSQHRAQAVMEYLHKSGVTNPMTLKGYGKTRPVADNATAAGRQQNRRVVLLIVSGP